VAAAGARTGADAAVGTGSAAAPAVEALVATTSQDPAVGSVNGNHHGGDAAAVLDASPPVYANSDDPDSLATADNGSGAGKPARGRRRRASRPVSKPATETLEPVPPAATEDSAG